MSKAIYQSIWGVKAPGHIVAVGDTVTVTTKSGKTKTEIVQAILTQGEDESGQFTLFYPVQKARTP